MWRIADMLACLNIGSGHIDINDKRYNPYHIVVHVDQGYAQSLCTSIDVLSSEFIRLNNCVRSRPTAHYFIAKNVFNFLDSFPHKFNMVYAERIFEHMEYVGGEIGRLLESINQATIDHPQLNIVVPNSITISKMLLNLEQNIDKMSHVNVLNNMLIINTENQNSKFDPHGSTWTPQLAKLYIESEGTWVIKNLIDNYSFGNRKNYMHITCVKPMIEKPYHE